MMDSWYGHKLGFSWETFAGVGVFMLLLLLISVVLKGYALWNAAKRDEKWWFIILFIINTFGILELIYLYFIVGKWRNTTINNSNQSENKGPTV